MAKVAIIYHYIAHYRLPIFQHLMKSTDVEYTIFSGATSEIPIKTLNSYYSHKSLNEGGLRWRFLKNIWFIKKRFLWQKGVIRLVISTEFDSFIFLGSPYHISTWIGAILARIKGKKVYFWMHGVYRNKLKLVDYIKLKVFYKLANGFFLYGNRAKEILISHNVTIPENIHVIYNSLDYESSKKVSRELNLEEIKNFRKEHFSDPNSPIIIFIGRLNKAKKIDYLIKVQKKLISDGNKKVFNLIIIGDGEEKINLEKLMKKYRLEKKIIFFGALYNENTIGNYIKHSDLCVTPGEIGLTGIHSLSYGTPVISHDNLNIQMPEVEVIQDQKTGNLYKYEDMTDLENKIELWFEKYPIKNLEIMSNCYGVIDKFYNPHYQACVFDNVLKNLH